MTGGWVRSAIAATILLAAAPAAAIEPTTEEVVVLRNKVFDGYTYQDTLVPSGIGQFTLLAGADNALTYVQTLEYYWPLSRNFYAAFDKLNVPLDGVLRITSAGKAVGEAGLQPYVIVYPNGTAGAGAKIAWGSEARKELADYKAVMTAYNKGLTEARLDRMRYDRELKDAAVAGAKGEPPIAVAPPKPEPEPVRLFVTDMGQAYRIDLPPGRYEIALFEGALEVEGSRRVVDVITADAASAITFDVIPEERWTRVLPSQTVADTIYSAPGKTFYVALSRSDRFDEASYQNLVNPQAVAQTGRDIWVRRGPAEGKRLEMQQPDGSWLPIDVAPYKVRQTGGAELGYVIERAAPGETPDINAFAVNVPSSSDAARLTIRVADATGDGSLSEDRRFIVLMRPVNQALIWGAAAAPLAIGILVVAARRFRRP